MKLFNLYPLEVIEWYDAESQDFWASLDGVKRWAGQKMVITEVGFIVYEDKDNIVIASQISGDGDIGNRTKISTGWVKSRKKLR